mmetsp:Transcript_14472/g.36170  ORF Transcript_14472/g.36170 Transcript_14472/m.36170 type:complete len:353 (-) Transcript_14472:276-1334(-)
MVSSVQLPESDISADACRRATRTRRRESLGRCGLLWLRTLDYRPLNGGTISGVLGWHASVEKASSPGSRRRADERAPRRLGRRRLARVALAARQLVEVGAHRVVPVSAGAVGVLVGNASVQVGPHEHPPHPRDEQLAHAADVLDFDPLAVGRLDEFPELGGRRAELRQANDGVHVRMVLAQQLVQAPEHLVLRAVERRRQTVAALVVPPVGVRLGRVGRHPRRAQLVEVVERELARAVGAHDRPADEAELAAPVALDGGHVAPLLVGVGARHRGQLRAQLEDHAPGLVGHARAHDDQRAHPVLARRRRQAGVRQPAVDVLDVALLVEQRHRRVEAGVHLRRHAEPMDGLAVG